MIRRKFLKNLGLGAAAVVTAPALLASTEKPEYKILKEPFDIPESELFVPTKKSSYNGVPGNMYIFDESGRWVTKDYMQKLHAFYGKTDLKTFLNHIS